MRSVGRKGHIGYMGYIGFMGHIGYMENMKYGTFKGNAFFYWIEEICVKEWHTDSGLHQELVLI
jgi:hypothetical protein